MGTVTARGGNARANRASTAFRIDPSEFGWYLGVTHARLAKRSPMSTTTLKLPESLKARIAPLAEASGKTPHAWMVDALEAQASLVELRESFLADGEAAARAVDAGGPLFAAEDVRAYIIERVRGRRTRRPAVRRSQRRR